jgi:hypothetical protein
MTGIHPIAVILALKKTGLSGGPIRKKEEKP